MTDNLNTVLVVEDEPGIVRMLKAILSSQGFRVIDVRDAAGAEAEARRSAIDIVILDLGLPDRDGLEVIVDIRRFSKVPILVLSSRTDERAKVAALDAGADDYVTKPFGADELMARMRVALRHRFQAQGAAPTFTTGALEVDLTHRYVKVGGAPVKLSPKEYDILEQLVLHAGKVLTHRHLLREVWGSETAVDVQYLRVYVRQLRQKIERNSEQPELILTEAGVGYRLAVDK